MKTDEIHCAHACRNTCVMLTDALHREKELSLFYKKLAAECDYPDVQSLLAGVSGQHVKMVESLENKLSEMESRGQALDGVMSSFDPAGC